ncbi:hypothetical protein GCM10022214_64000 [Actinomadura miaoliensis]|uniref:DUF1990 domain-containing protein n=2 Tax=Actinomadura miaoliensis TaxID=430685 RepID=A0ABP7WNW4_9ACTN
MVRWPVGIGLAAWRWLRGSRGVARRRLRTSVVAEIERIPERGGDRLQHPRQGAGPAFQRRYTVRITGSPLSAEELIGRLCADINAASPVEFAVFDKTSGDARCLDVGDEYDVHMPGPWNCPVRVVEREPRSFRFATLEGHIEAGEIEFRAVNTRDGDVVFTIESWARSGSRLADVLYDRLRIAKEMQLHMWTHFCSRVAEMAGGRVTGEVEVHTERAEVAGDSRLHAQHLTQLATTAFTRLFTTAARLRGGRPLHPKGLVCDATLLLHGTSRPWGVSFLDDAAELRGLARLSRSVGLPPPLPDVLGLALRWRQPADVSPGSGGGSPDGEPAVAELLLATTGHGLLGRHLPRPAIRWSPAFYGSLLPYAAGDRRVFLGAVARRPCIVPAGDAALAGAVGESPLPLDLVIATEFGSWERFGELLLTGPARSDDSAPMRFAPARHQIPGLPPAGALQQIRGPAYAAVRQVAGPADDVTL